MNIKFKHLIIEGFLSMGYAELDLEDRGFVLINGINNNPDDGTTSNGAGKTTALEALVWCLTGETVRGISKNIANIHTDTGARVECEFSIDGKDYKLCRYKDHCEFGTNLKIYINGEDKSGKGIRDSEKLLSEYLPELTSSLIGSVIVLGQGLPQRFTNNTPAGRKEVLEKLSKSDFMIEDLKNRLAGRKTALSQELRSYEDAILSDNSSVSTYQRQIQMYTDQLNNLADPQSLIQNIQDAELKATQLQNEITNIESQLTTSRSTGDALLNQQSELNVAQMKDNQAVKDKYTESKQNLQNQIFQLKADINSLNSEIIRLESVKDVCPTCGQKLPDVHKVDTAEKRWQLQEMRDHNQSLQEELQNLSDQESAELTQVKSSYQTQLIAVANDLSKNREEVQTLTRKLNSYDAELRAQNNVAAKAKSAYEAYESTKNNLKANIETANQELDKLQQNIVYNTEGKDKVKQHIDVVTKMTTLATRDFRGVLLTNVIDYINKRAKIYSADIFNTDRTVMTLDGNALNISYDGKLYENLSGGERRKVDLIVSFAIRDMLCQFSSFSANILCLDEITDGVDDQGVKNIFNCITNRLQNLESIFIITHKSDTASIPVDSIITVVKDSNGVSSINDL